MTQNRRIVLAIVAVLAAGCSDGGEPITRDCITLWNEGCDYSLKASDEATAGALMAGPFKMLDKKKELINKRIQDRLGDLDGEEKKELDNTLLDYYDEIMALKLRLKHCITRLDSVIANSPENANLSAIRAWLKAAGVSTMGQSNDKTDFGKPLVPSRPKLGEPKKKEPQ